MLQLVSGKIPEKKLNEIKSMIKIKNLDLDGKNGQTEPPKTGQTEQGKTSV